jgi:uncharacterized membrane protein
MAVPDPKSVAQAKKMLSETISILDSEKMITEQMGLQRALSSDLTALFTKSATAGGKIYDWMKKSGTVQNKMYTGLTQMVKIHSKLDILQRNKVRLEGQLTRLQASPVYKLNQAWGILGPQAAMLTNNIGKMSALIKKAQALNNISTGFGSTWKWTVALTGIAISYFRLMEEIFSRTRVKLGVWRQDFGEIEANSAKIWKNTMAQGVELQTIAEASISMASSFGSTRNFSDDIRRHLALMETSLGVSTQDGAELLRTFSQLGKSTAESQVNMTGFLQKLSSAAGTPLAEVSRDIANTSKMSYSMMSRNPLAIAKAAVEARRLGTSLEAVVKSGKSLLNFTDSINAEMNASVLLGKSINLQRARELAYRRDLQGLNREILRMTTEEFDYNKLDYFQQEAFAAAVGKSTDELAKMIQARDQERWIMASGTEEQKKQLMMLREMDKANESIANDMGKQAAETLKSRSNQSKIVELQSAWKKLTYEVVDALFPLISTLITVASTIVKVSTPFVKIFLVSRMIMGVWKGIGGLLSVFPRLAMGLARFMGPIGLALSAIYVGIKFIQVWYEKGFVEGIKSIGPILFDALISPFKAAFKWLFGSWLANSPSEIGKGIVAGIKASGSSIRDQLTKPFDDAQTDISRTFGGRSIASNIISPSIIGDATRTASTVQSAAVQSSTIVNDSNKSSTDRSSNAIIDAINGLRSDLTAGKVAVYMDSQLVSTYTMRNTLFRKGYGTNNAVA